MALLRVQTTVGISSYSAVQAGNTRQGAELVVELVPPLVL